MNFEAIEEILLSGPFEHNGGQAWLCQTPLPWYGDSVSGNKSTAYLYEDGKLLGPGHSSHLEIRENGGGRYSHWCGMLWFSTSDGSDPNANGRTYLLRAEADRSATERAGNASARADYAFSIFSQWIGHIGDLSSLSGRVVCELGPGHEMTTLAICAGIGADVYCVERFPPEYDSAVHTPLFLEIARRLEERGFTEKTDRLQAAISEGSFAAAGIKMLPVFIEDLPDALEKPMDLCFSQAVLEHLEDPAKAFAAMARMMAVGGYGFHQVDFRDHHDFSKPLEFLLQSDSEFEESQSWRYSHGNRWRLHEYIPLFENSGFEVVSAVPNMFAEPAYLDAIMDRLATTGNRFSEMSREQLMPTSALMIVRRRA